MSHKWIKTLSAGLIALASYSANADVVTRGSQQIHSQKLDSIQHSGMLNIEKTTISGTSEINGRFKAKHSTLNDLIVNGNADLDNVVVNGPSQIHGKLSTDDTTFKDTLIVKGQLEAEDSDFEKTITLYTNHSKFENSQLVDLILETSHEQHDQHLYLEETHVKGNITVKGQGIIHMDKKSKIDGQVTGGRVEKS